MSKTIKIEIEIPAPPEGWGEVEYRRVNHGEDVVMFWDGDEWLRCPGQTGCAYPVARKLAPSWTPPPEFATVIRPGWIAMDMSGSWWWYSLKPEPFGTAWSCRGECRGLGGVKPELLPTNIPWDKCCFKIGDPQE